MNNYDTYFYKHMCRIHDEIYKNEPACSKSFYR